MKTAHPASLPPGPESSVGMSSIGDRLDSGRLVSSEIAPWTRPHLCGGLSVARFPWNDAARIGAAKGSWTQGRA